MKKTVEDIKAMKKKEKIAVLTCYDYSFAKAMDGDVEVILVGDSLGNVVLGYERTKHVTMEDMIRHLDAVKRGAKETFIVVDMPFGSYDNKKDAVENARKLINAGADAVKPEGRAEIVKVLADNGIKVMGHIGLLPQSAKKLGMVGKEKKEAESIIEEARESIREGCKELWITSQDTAAYGMEWDNKQHLPELLRKLVEIEGNFLIRLGMGNPKHFIAKETFGVLIKLPVDHSLYIYPTLAEGGLNK